MANPFYQHHFLSVDDLTPDMLSFLFTKIDAMKEIATTRGKINTLDGKIIACVFFEPSTRTFGSFTSAAQRLGAGIIPFYGMAQSSTYKGETFEDTIRTIGCSADAIVLRHAEAGSAEKAAAVSYVPIINAGDGGNEHPTQAVLDAYTIFKHVSSFDGITVGFLGDPQHSRTIRSLAKVLAVGGVKKFVFIAPESLKLSPDTADILKQHDVTIEETHDFDKAIATLDVLYANRIQKERFDNPEEYEKVKNGFTVTKQIMDKAKSSMILLDPLPRIEEIAPEVDNDPRALYLKEEMQNAVYTRMALLELILSEQG